MNKVIFVFAAILLATSLGAQDSLTAEQQAAKCEAQGGCAVFTRDEFLEILQEAMRRGYAKGLRDCNNNI